MSLTEIHKMRAAIIESSDQERAIKLYDQINNLLEEATNQPNQTVLADVIVALVGVSIGVCEQSDSRARLLARTMAYMIVEGSRHTHEQLVLAKLSDLIDAVSKKIDEDDAAEIAKKGGLN